MGAGGGGGQGFERGTGRTRMGDGGRGVQGASADCGCGDRALNWLGQLRPAETRDTAVVRRC